MTVIRTYTTSLAAELAKLALEGADIPAMVLGVDVGMEGGGAGVQLLVADEYAEAALAVLDNR